jgi:hypothetical protein
LFLNPAATAVTRRALALLATLIVAAAVTGYLGAAPASAANVPTTTSLALTPAQTTFGPNDALSLTATVQLQNGPGTPTGGNVTFSWGTDPSYTGNPPGTVLGAAPLDSSGSATLATNAANVSPLPSAGRVWIVATYVPQGGAGFGGSHSSATSITIGPILFHTTSTSIQTTPAVIQTAQPVTISAVVAENDGGTLPPSGAVTFMDNGLALGVQPLVAGTNSSTATLAPTSFAAGHHVITASYGGDGLNGTSTQTLTFDTPDLPSAFTTITTVTVSPSTIHEGDFVTITAHVNQTGVLTPPPGGNIVMFTANGIPLCQEIGAPQEICRVQLDSNWNASITVGGWSTASYDIQALYIGSTDDVAPLFSPSSGDTPLDVLAPAPRAATSISYTGDTVGDYQDVAHLSAVLTLTGGGPLADKPVTLALGAQTCDATTHTDGVASCDITVSQPTHDYPITASFAGDESNLPADDTAHAFVVTLEQTTLQTSVQGNSGGMTTLKGILLEDGAAPITGRLLTLTFGDGSCPATTDESGVASCEVATPGGTSATLRGSFGGDNFYLGANAPATVITFEGVTTTTYNGSTNGTYGEPTTLSAVLTDALGNRLANEPVTLALGTQSCAPVQTVAGVASCTIVISQPAGTYPISATFPGDGSFTGSSDVGTFSVATASTSLTVGTTGPPRAGDPVMLVGTLTAGGHALAGRTITLASGSTSCTATTDSSGTGSCLATISLPAGSYPINGSFAGNTGTYDPSSGTGSFLLQVKPTTLLPGTTGPLVAGDPVTLTGTLRSGATPVPGKAISLSLGAQTCITPATDANGLASCTVSSAPGISAATESGSFPGDSYFAATPVTTSPVVLKIRTAITVTGGTADFGDLVTLSAKVVDAVGVPIRAKQVTISLGAQTCSGLTDTAGTATCTITLNQPVGTYAVTASFAAQDIYLNSTAAPATFKVTPEETSLSLSFPDPVRIGSTLMLTGTLTEDSGHGVAGQVVFLTYGQQICHATTDQNGVVTCTVTAPRQSDLVLATTTFFSNASYTGSFASKTSLVYGFAPGGGSFEIGDRNASVTSAVTFWGAQWSKANTLSGGAAPSAFKGYAVSPAAPACGATWTTDPGNSAPPPAGSLPLYMAVTVTSSTGKHGAQITGNSVHVVIVKTDAGYKDDPGHAGTGTVVSTLC